MDGLLRPKTSDIKVDSKQTLNFEEVVNTETTTKFDECRRDTNNLVNVLENNLEVKSTDCEKNHSNALASQNNLLEAVHNLVLTESNVEKDVTTECLVKVDNEYNASKLSIFSQVKESVSTTVQAYCKNLETSKFVLNSKEMSEAKTAGLSEENNKEVILKRLEADHIFPLKKKSNRFPQAKFFCRLCEYHCDTAVICERHIKEPRHQRLMQLREANIKLRNLAPMTSDHKKALNFHLLNVFNQWALSNEAIGKRQKAFEIIKSFIHQQFPDSVVEVYGSTANSFALTSSDLNVNILCGNSPKFLKDTLQSLKSDTSGQFEDIIADFSSKVPAIIFRMKEHGITCKLTVSCSASVLTSRFLAINAKCDIRVRQLAVIFRSWAKLCGIDQPDNGALPSFAYDLMTVFFLQRCKPLVIPVLHEVWKSQASEADRKKENSDEMYYDDIENLKTLWVTQNNSSLAELWVELLRFYCVDFDRETFVIGVRQSQWLTRSSKQWASKKIAIEDPFQCKRNIAHTLSHHQMYEYIADRLRVALQYYAQATPSNGTDHYLFDFSAATLADKKGIAVICSVCQKQGHIDKNCPSERLPAPDPLPPMTRQFHDLLCRILAKVHTDFEPNAGDLARRHRLMTELNEIVKFRYGDSRLTLFGSSCNGFGFHDSDLDICLTFDSRPTSQGVNSVEVIEELNRRLRKQRTFYYLLPIVSAKVPILKFRHRPSQLDGDISLYNILAQHNTRLIQTYCQIDPRVKMLGYVIKVFAKMCDICDASKGSLSSYAYILMMLYFLQQRKPPVIPVLQELYPPGQAQPKVMIDGYNAWFFENLSILPKIWPHYGKNRETIAELWIGLLRFYVEEFKVNELVVSIRQLEPLTKFDKMWNGNNIAIEDPFDLNHDLGRGLTKKMNTYILRAFLNGRKHFGTSLSQLPPQYRTIEDYLFDPTRLTTGKPPDDNRCRRCGRIGHIAKDCMKNNTAKDSDEDVSADQPAQATTPQTRNRTNTLDFVTSKGGVQAIKSTTAFSNDIEVVEEENSGIKTSILEILRCNSKSRKEQSQPSITKQFVSETDKQPSTGNPSSQPGVTTAMPSANIHYGPTSGSAVIGTSASIASRSNIPSAKSTMKSTDPTAKSTMKSTGPAATSSVKSSSSTTTSTVRHNSSSESLKPNSSTATSTTKQNFPTVTSVAKNSKYNNQFVGSAVSKLEPHHQSQCVASVLNEDPADNTTLSANQLSGKKRNKQRNKKNNKPTKGYEQYNNELAINRAESMRLDNAGNSQLSDRQKATEMTSKTKKHTNGEENVNNNCNSNKYNIPNTTITSSLLKPSATNINVASTTQLNLSYALTPRSASFSATAMDNSIVCRNLCANVKQVSSANGQLYNANVMQPHVAVTAHHGRPVVCNQNSPISYSLSTDTYSQHAVVTPEHSSLSVPVQPGSFHSSPASPLHGITVNTHFNTPSGPGPQQETFATAFHSIPNISSLNNASPSPFSSILSSSPHNYSTPYQDVSNTYQGVPNAYQGVPNTYHVALMNTSQQNSVSIPHAAPGVHLGHVNLGTPHYANAPVLAQGNINNSEDHLLSVEDNSVIASNAQQLYYAPHWYAPPTARLTNLDGQTYVMPTEQTNKGDVNSGCVPCVTPIDTRLFANIAPGSVLMPGVYTLSDNELKIYGGQVTKSGSTGILSTLPGSSDSAGIISALSGNSGSAGFVSALLGNSSSTGYISALPGNSGSTGYISALPGNSSSTGIISALPGNSGSTNFIPALPGNSGSTGIMASLSGNSGNAGVITALPCNVNNDTTGIISAGLGNVNLFQQPFTHNTKQFVNTGISIPPPIAGVPNTFTQHGSTLGSYLFNGGSLPQLVMPNQSTLSCDQYTIASVNDNLVGYNQFK